MKEAISENYVAVKEELLNKILAVIQQLPYSAVAGLMEEIKKEGNIKSILEDKKIIG